MTTDYDSPWKEALDCYFQPFMAFFFPLAHADIDWDRGYEALDKELQQVVRAAEVGRRFVDKLVKVWLKTGEVKWILVHVEVQTWKESDFPERVYVYNYRLFDRYHTEVISLVVLADDDPKWRPSHFEIARWGFRAGINFLPVKLLDYAADEAALERDTNPFAVVVLAHLKTLATRGDPGTRHAWKVRLVKGLYDRGLSPKDVRQLFRFIDWVMDVPDVLERLLWDEILLVQEAKHMPFMDIAERVGLEKGLRAGIEACLKLRFPAEGLKLMPEIREIRNHEILQAILDSIEVASTPDELRKVWRAGTPTG